MALNLDTLIADYNGTALAVAGIAEWGFIPTEWYLGLPHGTVVPPDMNLAENPFRMGGFLNKNSFLKANWRLLSAVVPDVQTRLWICMYRYHLASYGILCSDLANRGVVENEYTMVQPLGPNWDDAQNNITGVTQDQAKDIAKHTKRYALDYMHAMVYVFSSRGHHWTPEYNDLYVRLQNAQFLPSNPGFPLPSQEIIYRLAIHCFGIKGPLRATIADRDAGNMAAAMFIRFTPHAPISGCAHITTGFAVIRHMQREAWYPAFETKFHNDIDTMTDEVNRIAAAPTTYHVASKVFGNPARTAVSVNATRSFDRLNQFLLGYLDYLGTRHPLTKQQAVTKKSQGFGPLAEAFSRACDRFGKPSMEVPGMTQFLAQV